MKDIKRSELLEVMFEFQKGMLSCESIMSTNLADAINPVIDKETLYLESYIDLRACCSKLIKDVQLLLDDEFAENFEAINPCAYIYNADWPTANFDEEDEEIIGTYSKKPEVDLSACVGTLGEYEESVKSDDNFDDYDDLDMDSYYGYDNDWSFDGDVYDNNMTNDYCDGLDEDDEALADTLTEEEHKYSSNCGGNCNCGGTCGGNCKCHEEELDEDENDDLEEDEEENYHPTTQELVDEIMREDEELQKWQALQLLHNPIETLTEEQLTDLRRVYDRALLYLSENYKYKTPEEFIKAKHAIVRLNADDTTLRDLGIKIVAIRNIPKDEE